MLYGLKAGHPILIPMAGTPRCGSARHKTLILTAHIPPALQWRPPGRELGLRRYLSVLGAQGSTEDNEAILRGHSSS